MRQTAAASEGGVRKEEGMGAGERVRGGGEERVRGEGERGWRVPPPRAHILTHLGIAFWAVPVSIAPGDSA